MYADVFRRPNSASAEWIEILYSGEAVKRVDVMSPAQANSLNQSSHAMARGSSGEETFYLKGMKTKTNGIENPANDESRTYVYCKDREYFEIRPAELQEHGIDCVPAWLRVRIH